MTDGATLCGQRSAENHRCQLEPEHTGPCSLVLWRSDGDSRRVFWWPGHTSSENINTFQMPRRGTDEVGERAVS
jgi:hypothetical protein